MRAAACSRRVAVPLLACALATCAPGAQAAAEVWPVPPVAVVVGPFAVLEPGPLALWTNPALGAAGPRWGLGACRSEPFGVAGLSRTDAAALARPGALAASLGASRFGADETSAHAWAVALAGGAAEGRLLCGVAVRRHERSARAAWAADFGLCVTPLDRLRVAAVARSAIRAGEAAVSPETEWELDAAWKEGGFAVAAGLARDAVGPLWSGLATRVDVGGITVYTVLGRLAGGETRVTLGLRVRLLGGVEVAAGQETGPVLPESRAASVEWGAARESKRAAEQESKRAAGQESRRAAGRGEGAAPAPRDSSGDGGLESLPETGAREAALERMVDAVGEALHPDDATAIEDALLDGGAAGPATPEAEAGRAAPRPGRFPRVTAAGSLTVGAQSWRTPGLGMAIGGALGVARPRGWRATLQGAASRDPAEGAALDEARAALTVAHPSIGQATIGAFDATLSSGLLARAPGLRAGGPAGEVSAGRFRSAARPGRAGVPAAWGAAVELRPSGAFSALALWGRTARDARPLAAGLWPAGGRFHRTALERERRGTLEEKLWAAALEWRPGGSGASAGLCYAAADFGRLAPRLLPGGTLLSSGRWLSASVFLPLRAGSAEGAWAVGPGGSCAHRVALSRRAGGPWGGSGRVVWAKRAEGFAPAAAWPTLGLRNEVHARWTARGPRGRASVWLGLDAEEWTGTPGAGSRGRGTWTRGALAGLGMRRAGATAALEISRSGTWREPGSTGAGGGATAVPTRVAAPWRLGLRATWASPRSPVTIGLSHTRRQAPGAWRESWEIACSSRLGGGGHGRIAIEVRPGALRVPSPDGFPTLERDPLGGSFFSTARTPGKVTAEVRFPLRRYMTRSSTSERRPGPAHARVLARCMSASENGRFELWFALTAGSPAAD